MKFEINEEGYLKIGRGRFMSAVVCPFSRGSGKRCGSWCALFGEPETVMDLGTKFHIKLELCKKTLATKAEDFEDKR